MLPILPLILGLAPEIARWIGGSQAGTVTAAVAGAVRTITGTDDPQAAAAALTADAGKAAELRVQLAKIASEAEAAQRQADLEELKAELAAEAAARQAELESFKTSIADAQSARAQTADLAKQGSAIAWGAPVLSGIILVSFAFMVFYVLEVRDLNQSIAPLANVLLGTLAAMATQVANYWLGSSQGSSRKEAQLRDAQDQLARSVPANLVQKRGGLGVSVDVHADDINVMPGAAAGLSRG